jgi:hypothetical protein
MPETTNWLPMDGVPRTGIEVPSAPAPKRYVVGRKAKSTMVPRPSRTFVGPSTGIIR